MKFHLTYNLLCVVLLFAFGCKKEQLPEGMPKLSPIKLIFTTDGGTPLEGAAVTLKHESPDMAKWLVGGQTDSNGVCVIRTLGRYNGAPVGKYKVIVQKVIFEGNAAPAETSDEGGSRAAASTVKSFHVIDKNYRDVNQTPLDVEVIAGKNPDVTLDTGKPVRDPIINSSG